MPNIETSAASMRMFFVTSSCHMCVTISGTPSKVLSDIVRCAECVAIRVRSETKRLIRSGILENDASVCAHVIERRYGSRVAFSNLSRMNVTD